MQGTRLSGGKRSRIRAKPLTEPGLAKGAEDEKVGLVGSGRRRACDAGAGGRSQDGHQGAAAAAAANPWDIAFGAALQSDYLFRGITQSNHKPSVFAYFEPRYNVTKDLQLYAGIAGSSISFPNRAAAEIDFTAGIRPTFGPLALDFGAIYYWYPGGQCFNGSLAPVFGSDCLANGYLPVNGNVIKDDLSFWEVYAKGTCTVNDSARVRRPASTTRLRCSIRAPTAPTCTAASKFTAPSTALPSGWGLYAVGRGRPLVPGHQRRLLLHPARVGVHAPFPNGIPYASYTTWNSASASPGACSRSTSATTIPT